MLKIGILQGRLTPSNGRGIQFFPTDNWQNEFRLAKGIGFSHVELLIKNDHTIKNNPFMEQKGVTKIKDIADASGIEIDSVHGFFLRSTDYPETLNHLIKQAAMIGAKTVLIPFFHNNLLTDLSVKKDAARLISSCLDTCEKTGVRLGIETELMADDLLEIINSFDSSFVGSYYDIGNMASIGADTAAEILKINKMIFGIHIKDRLANKGETVPIGTGCVDFQKTLQALKEIRFSGPMIIHGARQNKVNDFDLNSRYFNYINSILTQI
ncbi:sugar phosphate isomerase/epimerase [Candidatus Parcubacteria bacterium]|nr:MAG: sugar phosphate isomerase/epimerase [Candidatus Parcubacteria bacterium]